MLSWFEHDIFLFGTLFCIIKCIMQGCHTIETYVFHNYRCGKLLNLSLLRAFHSQMQIEGQGSGPPPP